MDQKKVRLNLCLPQDMHKELKKLLIDRGLTFQDFWYDHVYVTLNKHAAENDTRPEK